MYVSITEMTKINTRVEQDIVTISLVYFISLTVANINSR